MSKVASKTIKFLGTLKSKISYGECAKKMNTHPRALGAVLKMISSEHPELRKKAKLVVSASKLAA